MAKHPYTGPGLNTLVVKHSETGESVFRGTGFPVRTFFHELSMGTPMDILFKAFPELDPDDVSRVVRMAGGAIDMVQALVGPGPIEKVDERGKTGWENPEGLSLSDPADDPKYREALMKISDELWRSKGKASPHRRGPLKDAKET